MFEIQQIRKQVIAGDYFFSLRGDQERQNDEMITSKVALDIKVYVLLQPVDN